VGLVILGIGRAVGKNWQIPRSRQLRFKFAGRQFKAKYNHKAGPRGGIEIVEELAGRGSPEGETVATITNLSEAEDFYNQAPSMLQDFIKSS